MNFALIASSIVMVLVIAHNIKGQKKAQARAESEFWAREHKANSTRRKSLDGLQYITIPLENFPTHILQQNNEVAECIEILEALTSQKIVNLTGYTNTDLKLAYGTANITPLSEYDQNYTVLVRTLQKWADILIDNGYMDEAAVLMKFAVDTGSDISSTYYKLADYYDSKGDGEQIRYLKGMAGTLNSSNRNTILKHLNKQ